MIGRFNVRRFRWSPLRPGRQSRDCEPHTRSEGDPDRIAAYRQMKLIHPWHIVAGLGAMNRQEICEILAVFDDASLVNLTLDKLSDLTASRRGDDVRDSGDAFRRRLAQTASRLKSSDADDDLLRLRLWAAIRSAFAREPALALSTRAANLAAADIAHDAAATMSETIGPERTGSTRAGINAARQLGRRSLSIFNRLVHYFGAVVGMQAARLSAEAAK